MAASFVRDKSQVRPLPDRYTIGMWVGLASVLMLFTALTSAYIVRSGLGGDWVPLRLPGALWASTALILSSSLMLHLAQRSIKRFEVRAYTLFMTATLLLGLGFLVTQILAWRQLAGEGIYLSSNPHSSFFYVLTGTHAVHLIGGILGLVYLLLRTRNRLSSREAIIKWQRAVGVVALYWHFMDGLWVYLFLLLFLWR